MNWDAFKNRAQTNGKKRMPRRHRHAVELTATCACALLVTLSLVLPAFAAGASNDAQTESATVAATTDNSSSSSSNENVSGGGTSQDGSASASVEKDESSSDESSSASDSESSSTTAAAKAAPLAAAANAQSVSSVSDFTRDEYNATTKRNEKYAVEGTYQLNGDITTGDTIWVTNDVTIDLNDHTLGYAGTASLFHVQSGGKLTIVDFSNTASDNVVSTSTVDAKNTVSSIGKTASMEWNGDAPTKLKLTYYETKSTVNPDGISTTESCEEHEVTPGGVINATNNSGANSVIYMDGGELDLQGGMITMAHASSYTGTDGHIIDVNGGTFNMSGGYVCGGTFKTGRTNNKGPVDHGGGVMVRGGSMTMSGGVIAANSDGEGGGIYNSATLKISGGVVSGNEVPVSSYGGGISSVNGTLTVSGGCITNNVMSAYCGNDGWGDHGGGGIAARGNNGSLSITGGFITGNKSQEAGGGVYAGANNVGLKSFTISDGTIASNASENSEGGGVRVSQYTKAVFDAASGKKIYISNNACNSTFDWGGGGVFVQAANSVQNNGDLVAKNALITNNTAGGYGGGVAACPTGETVVTHTQGAAIYGNHDAGTSDHPNFYQGTVKNMDSTFAFPNSNFRNNGHADYFLVRGGDNSSYISVITGRMLGDGAAKWSGSIDGVKADIDPNSGAEAKYMVGLKANPDQAAKDAAIGAATLIISGNYSHNHGGGIMTNGGVTLGNVKNIDIYPGLSFDAKKSLTQDGKSAKLTNGQYTFVLLSPTATSTTPSWNENRTLNYGGCTESARTTNDADGNIHFNVSSKYSQAGEYHYYVAEIPNSGDTTTKTYDKTIYRIDVNINEDADTKTLLGITFKHYTISNLRVTPIKNGADGTSYKPSTTTAGSIASFTLTKDGDTNNKAAFSNELNPYSTYGSFAPEVKKHVEGGEVKGFQFELYDHAPSSDGTFTGDPIRTKTISKTDISKTDGSYATVKFDAINYTNLGENKNFIAGKGGTQTYTYYICEKSGNDNGYTYDDGYYKVVVTATDAPMPDKYSGTISTTATYTYVDANGHESSTSTTDPTFNNKYATSLPSAGQAGIALAYVAGAAALAYGIVRLYKTRSDSRKGGDR